MRYLTLFRVANIKFGRRKKIVLSTLLVIALLSLLGTAVYATGLLAQVITLVAGETATIVCDGEHLHLLSQTTQQIEVVCENHQDPTPTPEPTNTPPPEPTNTPELPPPPSAGGFDPRQIPVEMQAWWMPAYGHIHAAAKLPLGQTVSGVLNLDVRIVLHHNPSSLEELSIAYESNIFKRIPLDHLAPNGCPTTTCAFNIPVSIDTTQMPDGWRELRIRAITQTPDDKRFLNSSGIPIFVENGNSRDDYNRFCNNTSLIGRGWYEGFGYTNAIIECVPLETVSGVHTFRVRAQKSSQHLTVALDKSHFIPATGPWPEEPANEGSILFDQDGDFQDFFDVAVDTTQLANGWHSLSVTSKNPNGAISQCDGCPNEESFSHGVAKIWFYVQN